MRITSALTAAITLTSLIVLASPSARAARFVVRNADAPGEGLNDPSPLLPKGGNPATTVGAARFVALQSAADIWSRNLESAVLIEINATFDPLPCSTTSALLGSAGSTTVHRDFPSAPSGGVWFPQALANAIAQVDLDPSNADISATFTSSLDAGVGCLGGQKWYYGLDANPPSGALDFVTVALHELAHGLGFATFVDLATGAKLMGHDDIFMQRLEQRGTAPASYPLMTDAQRVQASTSDPFLAWTGPQLDLAGRATLTSGLSGGEVRLHAPSEQVPGSSVSHFSAALLPNELMEPTFTGSNHDLRLTTKLLFDVGWLPIPSPAPALPLTARWLLLLGLPLLATLAAASRRRVARRRITQALAWLREN